MISEYGVGSTFFFDLDVIHDGSTEKSLPTELDVPSVLELSSVNAPTDPLKFYRTLIVDDSQLNRKLMRKLLTTYFENIDEVRLLYLSSLIPFRPKMALKLFV